MEYFPQIYDTKYICQLFEKGEINNNVKGLYRDLMNKSRLLPFNNVEIDKGKLNSIDSNI